jgi:hypothetical protein
MYHFATGKSIGTLSGDVRLPNRDRRPDTAQTTRNPFIPTIILRWRAKGKGLTIFSRSAKIGVRHRARSTNAHNLRHFLARTSPERMLARFAQVKTKPIFFGPTGRQHRRARLFARARKERTQFRKPAPKDSADRRRTSAKNEANFVLGFHHSALSQKQIPFESCRLIRSSGHPCFSRTNPILGESLVSSEEPALPAVSFSKRSQFALRFRHSAKNKSICES